jgi:hypothetical protein
VPFCHTCGPSTPHGSRDDGYPRVLDTKRFGHDLIYLFKCRLAEGRRCESLGSHGDNHVADPPDVLQLEGLGADTNRPGVVLLIRGLRSYRLSHRAMSISRWEPSHDLHIWARFRSPSNNRQCDRESLIHSSRLTLVLVCTSLIVEFIRSVLSPG